MAYIKYGVVTKIRIIKNQNKANEFIENSFNLKLYNKKDENYYLKQNVLAANIKDFREEVMKYTNNEGDSLNNCEAYCLEKSIEKVINSRITMTHNNERYYFSCNKKLIFETEKIIINDKYIKIKLFIIPIFWDINSITYEEFLKVSTFVNNISRKAFYNSLKDASFFAVI